MAEGRWGPGQPDRLLVPPGPGDHALLEKAGGGDTPCKAKIGNLCVSTGGEQHIPRFQVAVDNPPLMGNLQSRQKGVANPGDLLPWKTTNREQAFAKIATTRCRRLSSAS